MTQLRGQWQSWEGRAVMPIFHPAYLLRNPSREEGAPIDLTRRDLAAVRQRLCEPWPDSGSQP
jgi:DNA polymerase